MARSEIDPRLLSGLSLAEAFHRCVLKEENVMSAAKSAPMSDSAFTSIFGEGQYPGPTVEYMWPVDVTADTLAYQFIKPIAFFTSDPDPEVPPPILMLCQRLAERIGLLRDLLIHGRIIASGTYANTGLVGDINRFQWARRDVLIDVRNSDVLQEEKNEMVLKWSGVSLQCASESATSDRLNETNVSSPRKKSAARASIRAAIASLWPDGIPEGLQVQVRDKKINEWQSKEGQAVTSSKTIKRELDGD